jgi:hypothetical protein
MFDEAETSYRETRQGRLRQGQVLADCVSVAGLITAFNPASTRIVETSLCILIVKAGGFSAAQAKSLTHRTASSRSILLPEGSSSHVAMPSHELMSSGKSSVATYRFTMAP